MKYRVNVDVSFLLFQVNSIEQVLAPRVSPRCLSKWLYCSSSSAMSKVLHCFTCLLLIFLFYEKIKISYQNSKRVVNILCIINTLSIIIFKVDTQSVRHRVKQLLQRRHKDQNFIFNKDKSVV